jgi:hypothetical protein
MKKNLNLLTAFLLLTGMIACNKEKEIDMSGIDFSNIENLYEQPLPVIQKAIQGKWKVYQLISFGVSFNVDYPEDLYIEFKDNYHVIWESEGKRDTTYFTWKKTTIENWRNSLNGHMTYVMWKKSNYSENWYFNSILNDTLNFGAYDISNSLRVVKN